jgi:hypothetical protein
MTRRAEKSSEGGENDGRNSSEWKIDAQPVYTQWFTLNEARDRPMALQKDRKRRCAPSTRHHAERGLTDSARLRESVRPVGC